MALVVLIISLLLFFLGIWLDIKFDFRNISLVVDIIGTICVVFSLIMVAVCAINLMGYRVVDERIVMYEEENDKIEEQLADIVDGYQKYETEIFVEVSPDSAVSLASLYPELKSDVLVQAQIEAHISNNNKIKELKDRKITADAFRWWLYFGK